jgi:hypothetical protein
MARGFIGFIGVEISPLFGFGLRQDPVVSYAKLLNPQVYGE